MGSLADRDASTMFEAWETKKAREQRQELEAKIEDSEQRKRMLAMAREELNSKPLLPVASATGKDPGGGGVQVNSKGQAQAAIAAV